MKIQRRFRELFRKFTVRRQLAGGFIAIGLVFASALVLPQYGGANNGVDANNSRVLVRFSDSATEKDKRQILDEINGTVEKTWEGIDLDLVTVAEGQAEQVASALEGRSQVKYAEPDYYGSSVVGVPNDSYYYLQYALEKIEAASAWDTVTAPSSVKVAVLDSGIMQNHEDLAGRVVATANFSSDPSEAPILGHGTSVAGVISANTNNGKGIAGVGHNASLMSGKIVDSSGHGHYSWYIDGIMWATDNGADVINMSLGQYSTNDLAALEAAVNYAWDNGVVVVAGAGNSGTDTPFYPAALENVIAVAATDEQDQPMDYASSSGSRIKTNFGSWVDVAAPGERIASTCFSTTAINRYCYNVGTSFASPHVAGLAALIISQHPDWTNQQVREQIEKSADKIAGTGTLWEHGRINANNAVNNIFPSDLAVTSFQLTDIWGVEKTTFDVNERIFVKVTIKNNSSTTVPSTSSVVTQIYENQPSEAPLSTASAIPMSIEHGTLEGDSAYTYGSYFFGPSAGSFESNRYWRVSTPGTYTARAFVNYNQAVGEGNLVNNQPLTVTYTVQ